MSHTSFESHNGDFYLEGEALADIVGDVYRVDETTYMNQLLSQPLLSDLQRQEVEEQASALVQTLREDRMKEGGLEAFLFQYDLSSQEGIALMCMAEALLRVPDKHTVDKLIRDKLTQGDWESHLGKSHSMFVNAATWALMLTGKVLGEHQSVHKRFEEQSSSLSTGLKRLAGKGGEPLVRQAVHQAMRILSKQFVMGRTIEEALKRSKSEEAKGYRYSYDMLGEAAFTQEDAQLYFQAYKHAIEIISAKHPIKDPIEGAGISVKLSALHPRFEMKKRARVLQEMTPKLKELVLLAKQSNMNFTVDAEEADNLYLLMEAFSQLMSDPQLQGWKGLGIAVQAYQKRAVKVLDILHVWAQKHQQPLMVRLVKGAYWDTEIKMAQVAGLEGYPVFTRKAATDVHYLVCARKLLSYAKWLYPQFATHNAHTVASVRTLAKEFKVDEYEFQCLHGMGAPLYDQLVEKKKVKCRIYAPVGTHEHLLAYLVRRLLENGANTSFVNRIVNAELSVSKLVENPVELMKSYTTVPHPKIPLPEGIFPKRKNSSGVDLNNPLALQKLSVAMDALTWGDHHAQPTALGNHTALEIRESFSPFNRDLKLGSVTLASTDTIESTLDKAHKAFKQVPSFKKRAQLLNKAADLLEAQYPEFIGLLIYEGGKTYEDAVAEVREAVDFCRFYANEAIRLFEPNPLPGPTGEYNEIALWGKGVVACISPWNFPLAIFLGQVTAAFAAGNTVIAKPASQTCLVAQKAIHMLHEAGIEKDWIQLLPGSGKLVGNSLVEDPRIQGILFTGSLETARSINQKLAHRPGAIIPFIAETGGQNAMIVDSTALTEQVVMDVITSAFQSAGQRCSALRVLYIQDDVADRVITMLKGAMHELSVGDPRAYETDIGPVIDKQAQEELSQHIQWLEQSAKKLAEVTLESGCAHGTFIAPCAYEIDSIKQLKQENFGPVLHVIRFSRHKLDDVIDEINATGFGLTFGVHSRIDETVAHVYKRIHAGNVYVNRNIIGAVVGAQPFGGEGLSGTGPKAGGPNYLARLTNERTLSINTTAAGGNASLMALSDTEAE